MSKYVQDVNDIEVRLQKLEGLWTEFFEYEDQIALALSNNPNSTLELKQEEFETKFFEAKCTLLKSLRDRKSTVTNAPTSNTNSFDTLLDQQRVFLESLAERTQAINERSIIQSSESLKLPRVNIEKFTGEYEAWPSFFDLYTSSVHNVDTISNVHKFQILKGLLGGPPLNIIRNFLVTDTNYCEAWEKLVKRYNKKRPILNTHIDRFCDQPSAINGSIQCLRQISDTSDEIIRGIKALGQEAENRDPWLIRILLNKVDEETRTAWANETLNDEFPTIFQFLDFLNNRCYAKESALCDKKGRSRNSGVVKSMYTSSTSGKCPCCHYQHTLNRCLKFKRMPVYKRRIMVNQSGVCYNCLKEGHSVSSCPADYSCRVCKLKHHTYLHLDGLPSAPNPTSTVSSVAQAETSTNPQPVSNFDEPSCSEPSSQMHTSVVYTATSRLALLPTALVYVRDSAGTNHLARALLDSGSQSTFIIDSLVQKLQLKRSPANVRVSGISESQAEVTKGVVKLTLQSRFEKNDEFTIDAFILTRLTSTIPQSKVDATSVEELMNHDLQLADPSYNMPSKIDILLGADIFFEVLKADKFKINNQLIMQSTRFGWVVAGSQNKREGSMRSYSAVIQEVDISRTLEQFWKLEEVPISSELSEPEEECERHYVNSYIRNSEGRYVVRLPFKVNSGELGQSKAAAVNRLMAMERKFVKNGNLHNQYTAFMEEYLQLGHMEPVHPTEVTLDDKKCFYLPHHAVIKNDSTTTKLRVVFDGSCKSASRISLNDKMLIGATLQRDLISILMMFRKHAVAFSSDVEKMYRQIIVNRLDQDYQRIVWRKAVSEPIQTFRLTTVTYGTSCAPFLAIRTLCQLAEDHKNTFPVGSLIAKRDFYVDDCLSGADSLDEAVQAMQEVSKMLSKGGLILRKWKSNSTELMNQIPQDMRDEEMLHIDDDSGTVKTLGLQWNPIRDTFSYKINVESKVASSKRELLSQIARIFDPLGWISPIVIVFKLMLQKLWLRKLNWDDPLPEDLAPQWKISQSTLLELKQIEVPRFLLSYKSSAEVQLHGFCDASEHAYGAVIYIRTTDATGKVDTRIVISKTKVAALKQVSLPRLELCGAVLLSRLIQYTKGMLEIENLQCWAWTDSEIVLSWLSDVPRRWKCFIGNRTSEILEILPRCRWNHVTSKENPADITSRGVTPKQLLNCQSWWNGPHWLVRPVENWPTKTEIRQTRLEERAVTLTSQLKENDSLQKLFTEIESFSKIKRILARILRIKPLYRKMDLVDLLKKAENLCVKWAQSEDFHDEIHSLNQNQKIGSRSKLISLSPFIDREGLLRVGGRLQHLNVSFNAKHPMILPKAHILCDKIIRETHIRYLHPGPTLHISILRQKYWILNCRNAVRYQNNKCVECRRQKAATSQQLMGSLPRSRITPSRPFLHTGVDYAGPLYLKSRLGRGRISLIKGYICVFICFATKAIHIELSHDMTAEAFIAALRRFSARRGIPVEIISDNGTNFVGAKRLLGELYEVYKQNVSNKLISNFLSQNGIKFSFNPPSGPHFGGLWESAVKSIKHHLNRVTKGAMMTAYETETLLVQIEGILNSRPLCPMTEDVDDLCALTPAHFLIGEPLTTIPEPSLEHLVSNRLSRWQNVQARMQSFWKQWQIQYLHMLQQRRKWNHEKENLKTGDLVIIKDENLPPTRWLLGRIITLHPGSDGLVRVVSMKTSNGIIKRPIVKICKLLDTDETTSLTSSYY